MCGISGIVKFGGLNLTEKEKSLYTEILKNTEARGTDATGIFVPTLVWKLDKPARNFVRTKVYKELLERKVPFIMGHNRLTTVGTETIIANNHPFMTERFAFAHNGTFNNHESIRQNQELKDMGIETDSYVMLQLIDKYIKKMKTPVHKAIHNACEDISGVLACWLWDKDKNHLYLFRRAEWSTSSPLSIVFYRNMLIFCSDLEYIRQAILKVYGNANITHYSLENKEMLRIDLNTKKTKSFELPTSRYGYNCNRTYNYNTNRKRRNKTTESPYLTNERLELFTEVLYTYGMCHLHSKNGSQLFEINNFETVSVLKSEGWALIHDKDTWYIRIKNKNLNKIADLLYKKLGYLEDDDDSNLDRYRNPLFPTETVCRYEEDEELPEHEEELRVFNNRSRQDWFYEEMY